MSSWCDGEGMVDSFDALALIAAKLRPLPSSAYRLVADVADVPHKPFTLRPLRLNRKAVIGWQSTGYMPRPCLQCCLALAFFVLSLLKRTSHAPHENS